MAAELEARCRTLRIEPLAPDRVERIIRDAVHAYQDRFTTGIHRRLAPEVRDRLDALLQPAAAATSEDDETEPPTPGARALLNFVRGDPGRASVDSVMRELERLETIRAIGLPDDLFTFFDGGKELLLVGDVGA